MYAELKDRGFVVLAVALDKSAEDARPWAEEAKSEHPVLVDSDHVVADLYGIINVPTVVWIDEYGKIVRPCDVQFSNDLFIDFHGKESAPHLQAVRDWVVEDRLPLSTDEEIRKAQMLPTEDEQLARTHFALAWHLHQRGDTQAAEGHFERAGELAPYDFTIRRASMPIRGQDPFGEPFFALYAQWKEDGSQDYEKRSVAARKSSG